MRMKILAVIFLLGFVTMVSAQENAARKKDHDELRTLTKTATAALNSQDYDKLSQCFVDDFTFITVDQTVVKGKKELETYYKGVLANKAYGIKSLKIAPEADILTKFPGTNVGYCYGTADNTYVLKSGKTVHMESRWSANLVKKDGKWKIVMVHAGVNFVDNPLFNSVISSAKGTMISMSVLVFVLIALILYLLIKNKKLAKKQSSAEPIPAPKEDQIPEAAPSPAKDVSVEEKTEADETEDSDS